MDDNDDFGDFGDFQTCQIVNNSDNQQCLTPHIAQSEYNAAVKLESSDDVLKNSNIFELDSKNFDSVIAHFDRTLADIFPIDPLECDSSVDSIIHSQEDSITDCPLWWNLTGSFKSLESVTFRKSKSFDLFLEALRSSNSFVGDESSERCSRTNHLDTNHDFNDISLASELDMHSLVIDTSSEYVHQPSDETINADKIIEEIENMMQDHDQPQPEADVHSKSDNPIQALNASSLLNAALDSWGRYQDIFSDEDDDNDFRSLPLNIQSSSVQSEQFYNTPHHEPTRMRPSVTANSLESSQASTSASEMSNSIQNSFVERIQRLSIVELNELLMEIEHIIQFKSEILIQELALREELENEKELKNTFISSLLSVQNKRRLLHSADGRRRLNEKSRQKISRRRSDASSASGFSPARFVPNLNSLKESLGFSGQSSNESTPIFLTTVIPYNPPVTPLDTPTLEMLIKLLNAMDENSPTLPQLLTDYILKVICT